MKANVVLTALLFLISVCFVAFDSVDVAAEQESFQTSEIHLLEPDNDAELDQLPTFVWSPGTNNRFRVEFSDTREFGTIRWATRILASAQYTPPPFLWIRVEEDNKKYWRVRGADVSVTPIIVHTSAETWSFKRKVEGDDPTDGDNIIAPPDPEEEPYASMNLIALHDSDSPQYLRQCVRCHGSMKYEISLNRDISGIHVEMLEEIPGNTNNARCLHCHLTVDLLEDSAMALRRQVDPNLCAACHGPGGEGGRLYAE
jgi:cytochrome c553